MMAGDNASTRRRRHWIVWLAAGLAALAMVAAAVALAVVLPPPFAATSTATATIPPTITLTPLPSPSRTPASPTGLPLDIEAAMDAIELQVSQLRGLRPRSPVERLLVSPQELQQRLADRLLHGYSPEQAAADSLLLTLLGAVEPDIDLWALYQALYAEQVAGYYDEQAGLMVIVSDHTFDGIERLTYAHEFAHALQDQTYDLDRGLGYTPETCRAEPERCRALLALLEGDATLLTTQWLRIYATPEDMLDLQNDYRSLQTPVFHAAPEFLQRDFLFPYLQGLNFVTDLYIEGNWPAVDAAYAQPPITSEHILHPERYPRDLPSSLDLPQDLVSPLGVSWREVSRGTLGEWMLRLTLETRLPDAAAACEGWGGDRYVVLADDASAHSALIALMRWDRFADAQEFFSAFQAYGQARFGPGSLSAYRLSWSSTQGEVLLERHSDQTLLLLAPDPDTLAELRQAIRFPAPTP